MDELKPCPFCGVMPQWSHRQEWLIHPRSDQCPIGEFEFSPQDAAFWNRRATAGVNASEQHRQEP